MAAPLPDRGAPGTEVGSASALGRYTAVWLAAALPTFVAITLLWRVPSWTTAWGDLSLGAFALTFPVLVRRLGVPRGPRFVDFLLVVGVALGVLSILTGWANGLTDEPFTTPRFAGFTLAGHNPYTTQLVFSYQQYGRTLFSSSHYVYLPLLMFLQFPGVDYKWFTLTSWGLVVLLCRRRFDAGAALGQPYVLLVAASGYNDLPVLLLLTLGFVGLGGRRVKWAEYLALGCKQFANAFVVLYYLVQRRWRETAVTLLVSAAFLVPFVVWGGTAVLCPAVFADRFPSCGAAAQAGVLLNYPVWAVWVVAVFYVATLERLARWSRAGSPPSRSLRAAADPKRWSTVPAGLVVAASAAFAGLLSFVAVVSFTAAGPWAAAVAGSLAAAGWSVAWDPPRRAPGTGVLPVASSSQSAAVLFGVLAGVGVAGFVAASLGRLGVLPAEEVALAFASLSGLAWRFFPGGGSRPPAVPSSES